MKSKQEVEIIKIPKKSVRLAIRRTAPMVRHWAVRGTDSLSELVAAVYLQGVQDGFEAAGKTNGVKK